jgi:hypothetical protein
MITSVALSGEPRLSTRRLRQMDLSRTLSERPPLVLRYGALADARAYALERNGVRVRSIDGRERQSAP